MGNTTDTSRERRRTAGRGCVRKRDRHALCNLRVLFRYALGPVFRRVLGFNRHDRVNSIELAKVL